jgi:hypothetical protein
MKSRNPRGWSYLACAVALAVAGAAVGAQQTPTPNAREIVDRFIRETGGEAAFKAIKSIRARGTISIAAQGLSGEVETLLARPAKMITRVTVTGVGKLEEGFDGKVGWSIDPVNGPAIVTGKALIERADEAWFDAALHTPDFAKQMTVMGREEFDKRDCYKVKVVLASGTEQVEYYDVETGLQLGMEATRDTPFGSAPTITIFRDYQKHGPVKLPTSQLQRVLGIEQAVTFTSYEFDVVPSSAFDLPPVIKALIK